MTQKDRVRKAYELGCRTTGEVSALLGLSQKKCSAYTRVLVSQAYLIKKADVRVHGSRRAGFFVPVHPRDRVAVLNSLHAVYLPAKALTEAFGDD